nr:thioesterase family protein [Maliibacterium massiliense]
MQAYTHQVHYYETDQMAVVHHSNYIRWFEEARIDYMRQLHADYQALEAMDCYSPVLSVRCQYKKGVAFGQRVDIRLTLVEMTQVKYRFTYRVVDHETGALHALGETTHCFVNGKGRVISLKKQQPALFARFLQQVGVTTGEAEGENF